MKLVTSTALDGLQTSVDNLTNCKKGEKTRLTYTLGKCAGLYVASGDLDSEVAQKTLHDAWEINKERFDDDQFAWENIMKGYDDYSVTQGLAKYEVDVGNGDRTDIFTTIHSDYTVLRNELSGAVEVNGEELTPSIENSIWMDYDYKIPMNKISAALDNTYIKTYNPVLKVAKKYDSGCSGSIDEFCSYVDSPDEFRRFFRKWFVNMVALGITNEPLGNPLMICLVGEQSVGKTELFRNLLPKELHKYMSDERLKLDSEYYEQTLVRHLIVLNDEMDQVSPKEMDAMKRLLTLRTITYRPLYTNTRIQAIRRGSMCGSGNSFDVTNDATGNRRMIPLEITGVRWKEQMSVCRGKMIAEAVQLIQKGFTLFLEDDDMKLLSNGMSEKFEQLDRESEALLALFKPGPWDGPKTQYWSSNEIVNLIEKHNRIKVYIPKFSDKMWKHGFGRSRTKRVTGVQLKRYGVIPVRGKEWYV